MLHYRCYFLEKDGATVSWRNLAGRTEDEAHDHALGLLIGHPQAERVEVWDTSRLTFIYSRSEAKTPAELRKLCYLAIAASDKESNPAIRRSLASCALALAQEAEAIERKAVSDPEKATPSSAGISEPCENPAEASQPVDPDEALTTGLKPLDLPCILRGRDPIGRELNVSAKLRTKPNRFMETSADKVV